MESNNTNIHFTTGVKMLYSFPQIPPAHSAPYGRGGGGLLP